MPTSEIPISLGEVLEVRGAVLTENEAWGVLSQAAEALQDVFIKGQAFTPKGLSFVIAPETLMLNGSGQVTFMESTVIDQNYVALEYKNDLPLSDTMVDKMYVYSLGKTLQTATIGYLSHLPVPKLSRNLESLFGAMCETDPNYRLALFHVLEACNLHAQKKPNRKSSASYIVKLHTLGSGGTLNSSFSTYGSSYGSDISSLTYTAEPIKEVRRRQRRISNRSRSRSRSPTRDQPNDPEQQSIRRISNPDRDSGIGTLRESTNNPRSNVLDAQQIYFAEDPNQGASSLKTNLPCYSAPQAPAGTSRAEPVICVPVDYLPGQYPPGYQKYLQLKERQRRLRAVRNYGGGPLSFRKQNNDLKADTKSLYSVMSYTDGTYMPDHQYGTKMASKVPASDVESILSSDVSIMTEQVLPGSSKDAAVNTKAAQSAGKPHVTLTVNPPINQKFIGPEFIHNGMKTPIRIPMPLQGESLKNPSCARRVIIVHLTGQKYEVICDPSTTGRQLFDVVSHIGITEYYYFGLTYYTDAEHFFIEPETKLHKVAPEGWKEVVKGHVPVLTFTVYIRVKYYMDSITDIRHDDTYHLMYLQLRRDIIEDRFYCTEEQALALTGLALQVEFGDYNVNTMGTANTYFLPEQYFSNRIIRKAGQDSLRDNAIKMHKSLYGHPPSQSELEFIKCIQKLPEYGIHYYKLLRNKNDHMSTVWVGISSHNLVIAENQGHERIIVKRHSWQSTQKISFNKRRFSVQPKPDYSNPKPVKINFYSNTYRKGKYLLQLSTAQHRFEMRMRTRPSTGETLQGNTMSADNILVSSPTSNFVNPDNEVYNDSDLIVHNSASSNYDSSFETGSIKLSDIKSQEPPLKYRSPPPYRAGMSYSMDDLREPVMPSLRQGKSGMAASSDELYRSGALHVIESNRISVEQNRIPDVVQVAGENQLPNESPYTYTPSYQSQHAILSSQSILGRHVLEVILKKEKHHGIGMTIVGGESIEKLDLGIFVKSVAPGRPADLSGLIFPGDRIIAINNHSLEGLQHHQAVQIIKNSPDHVKLLLSQVRAPPTLRRKHLEKDLSDELDELDHELAKSCEDIHLISNMECSNPQLSCSLDDLSERSRPPKKPARTRKTQEIESEDIIANIPQANTCVPTDHIIVESTNKGDSNVFHPEDIISGNLVNYQSSSLVSSIDMDDEASRPDNLDLIDGEVNTLQELEIVGEIAEMPINDSSSDSDFDSAIHDVIQYKNKTVKVDDEDQQEKSHERSDNVFSNTSSDMTSLQSTEDFYSHVNQDNIYEVELVKSNNGLGFSIQGGTDAHPTDPKQCIPRVKKVFMLGPAAESQILRAGDVILRVQNEAVRDLTRNELIQIMHTTSKNVKLLMCRPSPSLLPPIERSDSIDSLQALLHSHQVRLSAAALQEFQDSESETSTILSGRSSPMIPMVNRIPQNQDTLSVLPKSKIGGAVTPVLRRSWTDQQIASPPPLEVSSRDTSGILIRSQSEQVAANTESLSKSPLANNFEQTFLDENMPVHTSTSKMSPYGNFENLAALCSSDDYAQESSEAGSAWSDAENVSKAPEQILNDSSFGNVYKSPTMDVRNSTFLPEHDMSVQQLDTQNTELESVFEGNASGMYKDEKELVQTENPITKKTPGTKLEKCFHSASFSSLSSVEDRVDNAADDLDNFSLASVSSANSAKDNDHSPRGMFTYSTVSLENYKVDKNQNSHPPPVGQNKEQTKQLRDDSVVIPSSLRRQSKVDTEDVTVDNDRAVKQISDSDPENPSIHESSRILENMDKSAYGQSESGKESSGVNPGVHEFEVTLRKQNGGLGFTVAGSGKSVMGCYIKQVLKDPALSDGRLQAGDQLLEVNGQDMKNVSHFEAVTLLRQTPQLVRIKAYRPHKTNSSKPITDSGTNNITSQQTKSSESTEPNRVSAKKKGGLKDHIQALEAKHNSSYQNLEDNQSKSNLIGPGILHIKLDKESNKGFGFSLVTMENDNTFGVFVRTITKGGTADKDGRLCVGDKLIQVNKESVLGLNHTKVISYIRQTQNEVTLTVVRSSEALKHTTPDENKPLGDSLSNLYDAANETDEDINSLAGDAESFLKLNGTLNASSISLLLNDDVPESSNLVYKSPRKIPFNIPETLTDDWLASLPLLSISEDSENYIGEILHFLVEKVEQDEPFEEFKSLTHLKATDESLAANFNENKVRNRYRNVLPYDFNRVVLEEDNNGDYINASHIKINVDDSHLWYITGQGPLPNTVDHFWQMCWEQDVSVIAMLTLDVESERVKCHRYWPESPEETIDICDGRFEINLLSCQRLADFDVCYISITDCKTEKSKQVVHLNYTTWPDHGTPDSSLPILQFIRLLHLLNSSGPIVVHCSAGIGRSGSLIAIDIALLYMEHMKQFSIYDIVKELRQQRYGMIQTKDQYMFCYTACMQVLLSSAS